MPSVVAAAPRRYSPLLHVAARCTCTRRWCRSTSHCGTGPGAGGVAAGSARALGGGGGVAQVLPAGARGLRVGGAGARARPVLARGAGRQALPQHAAVNVAGAQLVPPPRPPVVLVGQVWAAGHVGRAHPCLAPRPPLELAGQPKGARHGEGHSEPQEAPDMLGGCRTGCGCRPMCRSAAMLPSSKRPRPTGPAPCRRRRPRGAARRRRATGHPPGCCCRRPSGSPLRAPRACRRRATGQRCRACCACTRWPRARCRPPRAWWV